MAVSLHETYLEIIAVRSVNIARSDSTAKRAETIGYPPLVTKFVKFKFSRLLTSPFMGLEPLRDSLGLFALDMQILHGFLD